MPIYYPHTTTPVTKSFEDRQFTAEFDDSLLDQAAWKNSRYDGAKLTANKFNVFTPTSTQIDTTLTSSGEVEGKFITVDGGSVVWGGDKTYQNLSVISQHSTALYIANTVIGGTEDSQFATIKKHSYVNINKILLINPINETVQIIDKATEPFQEFHRFITNDFPTGTTCKVKVLDESISDNLKSEYRVKMNKGWLLKTFDYNFVLDTDGVLGGSGATSPANASSLIENNSMYLYRSGSVADNYWQTGSQVLPIASASLSNQLRFRYGVIEMYDAAAGKGHQLTADRIGPSFASSSIIENKFTKQYYSGSFGFIKHQPNTASNSMATFMGTTGLGSASRFLGLDTLNFLQKNNSNTNLTEQEKTEIHVTFFDGTKDFAPGVHDERSISTFEVDQNVAALGLEQGGGCNDGLPTNHELTFKGVDDGRFYPITSTFSDDIRNAHVQADASFPGDGCVPLDQPISSSGNGGVDQFLQSGITIDFIQNIRCYVQGGALGPVGYVGTTSGSTNSQLSNMTSDNFYSGSVFNYEVSFLDKDHTLILDIDKKTELFDGIGQKGVLIIPDNSDPQVAFNIEYYLEKSGILDDTSSTTQNISPNTRS